MSKKQWPLLSDLPPDTVTPVDYAYDQLARADLPELIDGMRQWFPDLAVGAGRYYSDVSFYEQRVYLKGELERDIVVYVGRYNGRIMAAICIEKNDDNLTLLGRYGVCAPEHRRTGASLFAGYIMDALADYLGSAMAYSFVTLKSKGMQAMLERDGFRAVGILPFSDREMIEGSVKHINEIIYAKHYIERTELLPVHYENMTVSVRRLWDELFGKIQDTSSR
ncbi:N-acetyltransferase [Pseudomonas sp. S9]|uniref:N-acetyltransferase n=1 Tax=Pseudomonas sp. S9 TaxID=686578 RepID=UPI00025567AC|nr:N-acetyltransferase [Pseudomonas sp. S9]